MRLLSDLLSTSVKWVTWDWLLIEFFYCKSSMCKGRIRLRWRWWVQHPVCLKHLNCQPPGWSFLRAPTRRKGFKQQLLVIVKKINKTQWPHFPVLSGYVSCEFNCVKKASETICGQGPPATSVCPGWGSRWGAASSPDLTSCLPRLRCCQMPQATNPAPQSPCSQVALPAAPQELRCSVHYGKKQSCVCGHVLEWPSGVDLSSFYGHRLWLPSHPCANLALLPGASAWPWHMDYIACSWAAWGLPYSCPFPCLLWRQASKMCNAEYWLI